MLVKWEKQSDGTIKGKGTKTGGDYEVRPHGRSGYILHGPSPRKEGVTADLCKGTLRVCQVFANDCENGRFSNDPSLRWFPYQRLEMVWSDVHNDYVRFMRYLDDGTVKVATMNGISELEGSIPESKIRRPRADGGKL